MTYLQLLGRQLCLCISLCLFLYSFVFVIHSANKYHERIPPSMGGSFAIFCRRKKFPFLGFWRPCGGRWLSLPLLSTSKQNQPPSSEPPGERRHSWITVWANLTHLLEKNRQKKADPHQQSWLNPNQQVIFKPQDAFSERQWQLWQWWRVWKKKEPEQRATRQSSYLYMFNNFKFSLI